jgi:hypothetical protein
MAKRSSPRIPAGVEPFGSRPGSRGLLVHCPTRWVRHFQTRSPNAIPTDEPRRVVELWGGHVLVGLDAAEVATPTPSSCVSTTGFGGIPVFAATVETLGAHRSSRRTARAVAP